MSSPTGGQNYQKLRLLQEFNTWRPSVPFTCIPNVEASTCIKCLRAPVTFSRETGPYIVLLQLPNHYCQAVVSVSPSVAANALGFPTFPKAEAEHARPSVCRSRLRASTVRLRPKLRVCFASLSRHAFCSTAACLLRNTSTSASRLVADCWRAWRHVSSYYSSRSIDWW